MIYPKPYSIYRDCKPRRRSSSEIFSVERCSPLPWVMESLDLESGIESEASGC